MARTKNDLKKLANDFKKRAKKIGLDKEFLFVSALKRYEKQIDILEKLEAEMEGEPMIIEKTYVKGQANKCEHPAISAYAKTSSAANNTASTIMSILEKAQKIGLAEAKDDDEL